MRRTKLGKTFERWFCEKPDPADALRLVSYYHCRSTAPVAGFHRKPKFTFLIDLTKSEDELLNGFAKNTRYEVRRAAKDGIATESGSDQNEFSAFFDQFAQGKDREPLDQRELKAYWPHLLLTKALQEGQVLVMHSYLLDPQSRRACLLHSASQFRAASDPARRSLIGRANRLLHFQDMVLFQRQAFSTYDFGGCSPHSTDPELTNIHQFKQDFGGQLQEGSNYVSMPLYLLHRAKRFLNP